jgi:hypothetical protein
VGGQAKTPIVLSIVYGFVLPYESPSLHKSVVKKKTKLLKIPQALVKEFMHLPQPFNPAVATDRRHHCYHRNRRN